MTHLTYSTKSNAIRGFRRQFPDVAAWYGNEFIQSEFIAPTAQGVVIEIENVALDQTDHLGEVAGSTLVGVPVLRRSAAQVGRPVAKAHALFDTLPADTKRRDAIAAAVDAGIAYYTARTQYQAWSRR